MLLFISCLISVDLRPESCIEQQGKELTEVAPAEDLMREHGVLNRILLIYEECIRRIENNEQYPQDVLRQAAQIVRTFIEDYHEKNEENYIFPVFEKAKKCSRLTKNLRHQHNVGRKITDTIISLTQSPKTTKNKKR